MDQSPFDELIQEAVQSARKLREAEASRPKASEPERMAGQVDAVASEASESDPPRRKTAKAPPPLTDDELYGRRDGSPPAEAPQAAETSAPPPVHDPLVDELNAAPTIRIFDAMTVAQIVIGAVAVLMFVGAVLYVHGEIVRMSGP